MPAKVRVGGALTFHRRLVDEHEHERGHLHRLERGASGSSGTVWDMGTPPDFDPTPKG